LLEDTSVPATMIVGVHGQTDESLRLHEYSPVFDPVRFAAHETFFVDDVCRWMESRFALTRQSGRDDGFDRRNKSNERGQQLIQSKGSKCRLRSLLHPDFVVTLGSIRSDFVDAEAIPTSRHHQHRY
jgi:hypothetical protein